jgi:hypothetical protein
VAPTTAAPTTAAPTTAAPTTAAPTTAAPTPQPTSATLNSYLFYAAASSGGNSTSDFISYSTSTQNFTFRYNSTSETFGTYLGRRISQSDRITTYTHDVCVDRASVTYNLNYPQGSGQSSTAVSALFAHPTSMGTITTINDGTFDYGVTPVGGDTDNTQGTYTYNGVNYRLYRFLETQNPTGGAISYNVKVTACS